MLLTLLTRKSLSTSFSESPKTTLPLICAHTPVTQGPGRCMLVPNRWAVLSGVTGFWVWNISCYLLLIWQMLNKREDSISSCGTWHMRAFSIKNSCQSQTCEIQQKRNEWRQANVILMSHAMWCSWANYTLWLTDKTGNWGIFPQHYQYFVLPVLYWKRNNFLQIISIRIWIPPKTYI